MNLYDQVCVTWLLTAFIKFKNVERTSHLYILIVFGNQDEVCREMTVNLRYLEENEYFTHEQVYIFIGQRYSILVENSEEK